MKPARWMFYFDNGHIASDVDSDCQDSLIQDALESGTAPIICVPAGKLTAYVNLEKVKCTTREEIDPVEILEPEVIG